MKQKESTMSKTEPKTTPAKTLVFLGGTTTAYLSIVGQVGASDRVRVADCNLLDRSGDDGTGYAPTRFALIRAHKETECMEVIRRYNSHDRLVAALRNTTELLETAILELNKDMESADDIEPESEDGMQLTDNRALLAELEGKS